MPELGKYAGVVLTSYAVALGLIVALIAVSLWRGARARRALGVVEERQGRRDG